MEKSFRDSFIFTVKKELPFVFSYLKNYFKNPTIALQVVPSWEWPTLLLTSASLAALCGFLGGVVSLSISTAIIGLLLYPISSTLMLFLFSALFYYTFLFLLKKETNIKSLFSITLFSALPLFAFNILAQVFAPIQIVGVFVSALFLVIGLTKNLSLPRKPISKIIGGLFLLFSLFWVLGLLQTTQQKKTFHNSTLPESLDILQKEMNE